jgi:hypothetical protein
MYSYESDEGRIRWWLPRISKARLPEVTGVWLERSREWWGGTNGPPIWRLWFLSQVIGEAWRV